MHSRILYMYVLYGHGHRPSTSADMTSYGYNSAASALLKGNAAIDGARKG